MCRSPSGLGIGWACFFGGSFSFNLLPRSTSPTDGMRLWLLPCFEDFVGLASWSSKMRVAGVAAVVGMAAKVWLKMHVRLFQSDYAVPEKRCLQCTTEHGKGKCLGLDQHPDWHQ